jgi:hypothetical protein
VQREDRADVLEAAGGDDLRRSRRDRLLTWLEQQPDPPAERAARVELGQGQAGADQDRGVHIVPARVADTVDRGAVGNVLCVRQGQGVQVGPQRDDRAVARADVADETVALAQHPRLEPGGLQLFGDQRRRLELVTRRLGMSVNVTA